MVKETKQWTKACSAEKKKIHGEQVELLLERQGHFWKSLLKSRNKFSPTMTTKLQIKTYGLNFQRLKNAILLNSSHWRGSCQLLQANNCFRAEPLCTDRAPIHQWPWFAHIFPTTVQGRGWKRINVIVLQSHRRDRYLKFSISNNSLIILAPLVLMVVQSSISQLLGRDPKSRSHSCFD